MVTSSHKRPMVVVCSISVLLKNITSSSVAVIFSQNPILGTHDNNYNNTMHKIPSVMCYSKRKQKNKRKKINQCKTYPQLLTDFLRVFVVVVCFCLFVCCFCNVFLYFFVVADFLDFFKLFFCILLLFCLCCFVCCCGGWCFFKLLLLLLLLLLLFYIIYL